METSVEGAPGFDSFIVQLGSATLWEQGRGYERIADATGAVRSHGDAVLWLDFYKPRSTDGDVPYLFDVSPIGAAVADAGVDLSNTAWDAPQEIARLFDRRGAPPVGLHGRSIVTAFGVQPADDRQLAAAGAHAMIVAVAVTILVLPRCVVTLRHRPLYWLGGQFDASLRTRIYGAGPPQTEPFATRLALHDPVDRRWRNAPGGTNGATTLAQLILAELSASHEPTVGYASRALEFAEHRYFAVLDDQDLDEAALLDAQRSLFELALVFAEFGRALHFFLEWTPTDPREWFAGAAAEGEVAAVRRRHERALDRVRTLRQDLRASVDMMASTVASRQLVIAHRQEQRAREQMMRNERFMRDATLIASVVLLPTLIATIYGSNVALPFEDTLTGSILLLAAMAIGAALAWLVIRRRVLAAPDDVDEGG